MDPEAAEKGRLIAARLIIENPESRKRVEDAYGIPFCQRMYPEAYKSGFSLFVAKVRNLIPW